MFANIHKLSEKVIFHITTGEGLHTLINCIAGAFTCISLHETCRKEKKKCNVAQ